MSVGRDGEELRVVPEEKPMFVKPDPAANEPPAMTDEALPTVPGDRDSWPQGGAPSRLRAWFLSKLWARRITLTDRSQPALIVRGEAMTSRPAKDHRRSANALNTSDHDQSPNVSIRVAEWRFRLDRLTFTLTELKLCVSGCLQADGSASLLIRSRAETPKVRA
jgi:hypothetical protein